MGASARGADGSALAFAAGDPGIPALDAVRGPVDAGWGVVRGVGATAIGAAVVAVVAAADAATGGTEGGDGGASVAEGFDATDIVSSSEDFLALFIMRAAAESPTAVTTKATTAVRMRRGSRAVPAFSTGFDVVVATLLAAPPPRRAWGDSGAVPTAVATLTAFLAT